jgi:glucokinase
MANRPTAKRLTPRKPALRLLGDFGGTTVRLALQKPGEAATAIRLYEAADFPGAEAALAHYFGDVGLAARERPKAAAFAIAGPITGERIRMTNLPWSISLAALKRAFALDRLLAVNDFVAVAESLPHLAAGQRRKIGDGKAAAGLPIVAIGPGTGLGVAGLIPVEALPGHWQAVASEGGHVTLPSVDEVEDELLAELRRRFGHVSAERAISGQGLENLYAALSALRGSPEEVRAEEVTRLAVHGDAVARETIRHFCAMLGTVAGNLALTYGARGGVYLAGGIIGKLGPLFDAALFRDRFVAKGRYRDYLAAIPTYLVTHKLPALVGLAAVLDRAATRSA